MPDDEKLEKDEAQESPEEKSGGFTLPLKPIIIGAGLFVAAIVAFSVILVVFSSGPTVTEDPSSADATEQAAADTSVSEDNDSIDVEALEKQIFGAIQLDKLDGGTDGAGIDGDLQASASDTDSIDDAAWLKAEKEKLDAERTELETLKRDMDAQENRIKKLLAQIEKMESSRVNALAKLYDGMEAARVAPLLNQLTDEQAVQILMRMKPANAAKILGVMSPNRAASISARMINLTEE